MVARAREGKILPDNVTGSTSTLTNTGTFDHRVLDGAPLSTFLAELKDRIENPAILILSE